MARFAWPPPVRSAQTVAIVVNMVVFALVARWPKRALDAIPAAFDVLFLVAVCASLVSAWMTDDAGLAAGIHFEPYAAPKLGCLVIALIVPPSTWVGLASLLASGLMPIVHFYYWPPWARAIVPPPEPWLTIFYALAGILLYSFRRFQVDLQRQVVQARTRAALSEQQVRKFAAVRDLANSPLQSIELTAALLRRKHPDSSHELDIVERSLDRLRAVSTLLARYRPRTLGANDASFDPFAVLQQAEAPGHEIDRLFLTEWTGPPGSTAERDRARIEEALRFTSYGLEHASECAFWLGEDGRLVYVNQAACRSLGYTRSELLGMHISEFAPRIRREDWGHLIARMRREDLVPYESWHRRKDGSTFPVAISASYVEFDGRPYVLGFARDLGPGVRS
jgi:PAS domain S-box-containing protein